MFGFVRELIAQLPLSGWGMLGAYAALVAVLPIRMLEGATETRRQSQPKSAGLDQALPHGASIATVPMVVVEPVVLQQSVEVVAVKAAGRKLRIQRQKLGLKGQPLGAFRQAPRRATASNVATQRAVYKPRCTVNRAQRYIPQTRIIVPKAQRRAANVVSFPSVRACPTVGTRVKRAA
jgi:hypothetical protein